MVIPDEIQIRTDHDDNTKVEIVGREHSGRVLEVFAVIPKKDILRDPESHLYIDKIIRRYQRVVRIRKFVNALDSSE